MRILLLLALLFSPLAWSSSPDQKSQMRRPPAGFAVHVTPPKDVVVDPVPEGSKVMVPEWADSDSVLLGWVQKDFVSAFTQRTEVTAFADSDEDVIWWREWFDDNAVPRGDRFSIYKIPTDSIFSRDYGPEFIYRNRQLEMVDFEYYDWRPDDNRAPVLLAKELGMKVHQIGLTSEGGNILGDGGYRGYASTWLKEENKTLTEELLLSRLTDFLGWSKTKIYQFEPKPETWAHIDTFAKLVSTDTWIVAQFPEGSVYREALEKYAAEIAAQPSGYGFNTKNKVFRMPMILKPGNQTNPGENHYRGYINSLIHNQYVFVATYGDAQDKVALDVYKAAMPGYEVVPILAPTTAWGDAIHCRTRNIPSRDSLYIIPFHYQAFAAGAEIGIYARGYWPADHRLNGLPQIVWRTGQGDWQRQTMERMGEAFYTELPAQKAGTKLSYYIEAGLAGAAKVRFPRFAPLKTVDIEIP